MSKKNEGTIKGTWKREMSRERVNKYEMEMKESKEQENRKLGEKEKQL